MLGSGRVDSTVARERLRGVSPRWVPTHADLDAPQDRPAGEAVGDVAGGAGSGRHSRPARLLAEPTGRSRLEGTPPPDLPPDAPPDAPRPVWRLDAAGARGIVSLGLAAVVGALAVVIWGWPRGTPVDDAVPKASAAGIGENTLVQPSVSASSAADVVVDVDGEVRRPGVVELAAGSRVVDAIEAAGGVTRLGDTGALNLAEVLIDGQQVVVPSARAAASSGAPVAGEPLAPAAGASSGASPGTPVSLNSATPAELETLPGIGPVLAAAIVEWRTQNGGFTSVEQLQDVSGIGPATFAELAPLVRL